MEDPRKAVYEALEAQGLTELRDQLKEWNEDTVRAKTEAIVERNKAADLLQEVMTKIDDEKKANEQKANQENEEKQMEPQATPQTDEQVKALLAKVEELTKGMENERNLRIETENKAKEQRIKSAYSEKLNLKPEVKELLISNLLTQGSLVENDGKIGMQDKAGLFTSIDDHIKQIEQTYAPYTVTTQGGKQELPNASRQSTPADESARIKAQIQEGTKGRVQIRNM